MAILNPSICMTILKQWDKPDSILHGRKTFPRRYSPRVNYSACSQTPHTHGMLPAWCVWHVAILHLDKFHLGIAGNILKSWDRESFNNLIRLNRIHITSSWEFILISFVIKQSEREFWHYQFAWHFSNNSMSPIRYCTVGNPSHEDIPHG